jgi:hypothetical protein
VKRLLLAALALLVALAVPAAAHTEVGEMEVLAAEQTDGTNVRIEVGVSYEDEHLADAAKVTATVTHVNGTTVGPVDLPQISGARYGTVLDLPTVGEWTLTATSTGPAAEATTTFTVEADSPVTTFATEEQAQAEAEEATAPGSEDATDEGLELASLLVPGLVLLAVIALYIGYRRRVSAGD